MLYIGFPNTPPPPATKYFQNTDPCYFMRKRLLKEYVTAGRIRVVY